MSLEHFVTHVSGLHPQTHSGLEPPLRPPAAQKLVGRNRYRLRQGKYRVLYEIIDDRCVVVVVMVAHRSTLNELS